MTARRSRDRRPVPIRTDRDRALLLVSILAVFIVGWAVFINARSIFALAEPMMRAALSAWVSIGVTILVTTFSFVFVALSLVSVQFSPRIVRHFWHRDRFRALFLWSSIAVCAFCFVVQFGENSSLHALGLFLGAYQTFVLFPLFLGYLADNLNAATITKSIADRTVAEIDGVYDLGPIDTQTEVADGTVISERSGFLEKIDADLLVQASRRIAKTHPESSLRVTNYLGSFIEVGSTLVTIEPPVAIDGELETLIRKSFSIQKFRSFDQDVEYGIRQLVDIGIKAISPAVNDPTTCVNCIHYLGVIIKELSTRDLTSRTARELANHRISVKEPSFEQFVDDAFDQIYHFGRRDHVIVRTLIGVLTEIITSVGDADRLRILAKEVAEMELSELGKHDGETAFATAEQRNYVRKSLVTYYRTAATRADAVGESELAAEYRALQSAYSDAIE
ncbi:MAG: DUF2254 domain-containing protein [Acidobacteria bacterium]|nr:DUF2254 domain-containing protein [Acidobacteriota bacterium]